jgi:hypothetical protein
MRIFRHSMPAAALALPPGTAVPIILLMFHFRVSLKYRSSYSDHTDFAENLFVEHNIVIKME